jgi:endoglucanase
MYRDLQQATSGCRREFVRAALLIVAWNSIAPCVATQGAEAPKLTVVGRQLQDPDGNAVQLHGWHQPAEAWHCGREKIWKSPDHQGALRYLQEVVDTFTTQGPRYGSSHGWCFNQVRLGTDSTAHGTIADKNINMARLCKWTDEVLVPFSDYCQQRGVYVIVFPNIGVPAQSTTPEVQKTLVEIWKYWSSHPALKSKPNVQFELCNEPVQAQAADGSWGTEGQQFSDALVEWLQPMVDAIRANGADNIIWIPGLGYQGHYEGFAHKTVTGADIGYAIHIYPGYICSTYNFFKSRDNPQWVNDVWQSQYKPIADQAPVNITEVWWCRWLEEDIKRDPQRYGDLFDGVTGDDQWGFGTALKNAAEKQGNVSWCFHMTEHLLGKGPRASEGDPQGELNYADPRRDSAAVAAFKWSYEWRNTGPRSGPAGKPPGQK